MSTKKESKPELVKISQRIRKFLKALDLSQTELAKISKVNKATISNYCNAYSPPDAAIINIWVEKFNLNPNWLLLGEGPMFRNGKGPDGIVKEEPEPYQASQTEMTSELSSEFLAQAHLVEVVTKKLKEANAPDEVIQQAILAIVAPDVKCKKTEDKKIRQNEDCT